MKYRGVLLGLGAILCGGLFSAVSHAAIYGADNRRDVHQVDRLQTVGTSVAVAVGYNLIEPNGDGTNRIATNGKYGDFVCKDERFVDQPSLGVCSGFLISDRLLVTAGHCGIPNGIVDNEFHPFCENFRWYFGYQTDRSGATNHERVPDDKIYGCKRIIRAENRMLDEKTEVDGNDFMLIELDRPVSKDIVPAKIASRATRVGDPVYTIGFPTGLPAKYSGVSNVVASRMPHYFEVNLDTSSGNSGGPVYNLKNELVGILVSGYPVDFYEDTRLQCSRPNVCDASGKNCRAVSKFNTKQVSNYIQRIETVLPYVDSRVGR